MDTSSDRPGDERRPAQLLMGAAAGQPGESAVSLPADRPEPDERPQGGGPGRLAGGADSPEGLSSGADSAGSQLGLLYYSREPLPLKDFAQEVRAPMDVEQFAHQAELLLDMDGLSTENIVGAMLAKVTESRQLSAAKLSGAKEAVFVPGTSMLMARTIQGVSRSAGQALRYDQSWLCALCTAGQVTRRHMVIGRFRQPVNMGENAHEVRLFALVVTPSREKGTKGALETGRTFATMLADLHFRRRLLAAADETEFKALMLVRAKQLSRAESLKSRHKYMLDAAVHMCVSTIDQADGPNGSAAGKLRGLASKLAASRPLADPNNNGDGDLGAANGSPRAAAGLFSENPRTSNLFELIAPSSASSSPEDFRSGDQVRFKTTAERLDEKRPQAGCCRSLCAHVEFGKGLWSDFKSRIQFYPSDFRDAFVGPPRTLQKTVATIWFLYFGILLPTIAFSSLNTTQTHGHMGDLRKAIIGQAIGGLGFALLGGQPLVIIMTTAPLCLYTKVIHQMCIDYGFHFPAMYAAVGLWNGFFLIIYSLFGFSKLMKWCTRSTEEIFALFIVVAFITDASKDLKKNLNRYYYSEACSDPAATVNATLMEPADVSSTLEETSVCRRDTSLLFILLMLGTLWLSVTLYRFNKLPYLSAGKRAFLADYALPTAVIVMSFLGSFVFSEIYVEKFPPLQEISFERAQVELLPISGVLTALGLGFTLSLLFFMDQNISAAMVNAPQNSLKKGCAYHYDLMVVGLLNGFLATYGLPMMHGVLPHSPLHVRSLADIEERVEEGHLRQVVLNVRETRVTGVVAHILVLATLLLIPYPIAYIPTAVLNGLFLYMAVTSLDGLQMFERILLLFTEQSQYPPNHYIRRCPQRKIHEFTMLQLLQLIVMCLFGFSSFNIVEMFFPVIILLMIPFRHRVVPKYIEAKYLEALDGKH